MQWHSAHPPHHERSQVVTPTKRNGPVPVVRFRQRNMQEHPRLEAIGAALQKAEHL